jgi:hypothetical protein
MKIRVDGCYEDGHQYDVDIVVDEFNYGIHGDEDEDFGDHEVALSNYLWQWTGDGHGQGDNRNLGHYCEITILDAADTDLIGQQFDYDG